MVDMSLPFFIPQYMPYQYMAIAATWMLLDPSTIATPQGRPAAPRLLAERPLPIHRSEEGHGPGDIWFHKGHMVFRHSIKMMQCGESGM